MSNKEKVEKKIRELVPELQELSEGCEFDWDNEIGDCVRFVVTHVEGSVNVLDEHETLSIYARVKDKRPEGVPICFDTPDDYEDGMTFFDYAKIIGHPIHLEHVLRAVSHSIPPPRSEATLHDEQIMRNKFKLFDTRIEKTVRKYEWDKPFTEQPDDLYQFLAEVLGV